MVPPFCLCMIVKNESAILTKCLESVAPYIAAYAIADTGSTDGTPDLIRGFFAAKGIEGTVASVPFVDYSQARNAAIDVAEEYACQVPLFLSHLLLVDADMTLCADKGVDIAAVLASLDPQMLAFRVPQIAGSLRYHNTRILRIGSGARYIGKTHEYLSVPLPTDPPALDALHFHDWGNGANRPEKYTRDERLLKEALAENPADLRSHYYLGQTYREMGRFEDAEKHYSIRMNGGWEDEAWHAQFMRAQCLDRIPGREKEATGEALAAFQRRPWRAEPLYWLANRARNKGQNHLAVLYASFGQHLQQPTSEPLFVDTYPYTHGFREEISIAGFYVNRVKEDARHACQSLSRDRSAPAHVRSLARSNLAHYARPLSELAGGVATRLDVEPWKREVAHGEPHVPRFVPSTPSVAWIDAKASEGRRLATTVRWHNYRFFPNAEGGSYRSNDADGVVRSQTDILILDPDTLAIRERKPIREACAITRTQFPVQGFEDLRLFFRPTAKGGHVAATATVRDQSPHARPEIALLTLHEVEEAWEITACEVLPSSRPDSIEKNWMPVVDDTASGFRLMTRVDPPTVLGLNGHDRIWAEGASLPVALDDACGGGQILRVWGSWSRPDSFRSFLGIVHRSHTAADGTRSYIHTFLGFDDQLRAILESPPFALQSPGLEYAAGLAVVKDDLLISYHFRDREAWIHRLPLADVLALLAPIEAS